MSLTVSRARWQINISSVLYSPGFIAAFSVQLCVLAYQTLHKFKNKQKVYFIVLICMKFSSLTYSLHVKSLLTFAIFLFLYNASAEQVWKFRFDVL